MKNVIYKIKTTVNSKIYIGSAEKFNIRKNQHKFHLLNGTHHSRRLQNHVNKHGYECLLFEIIESDCIDLLEREQYWIDLLNPFFNILKVAGSHKGAKRTDAQKKYMKEQRLKKGGYKKGWKHSDETCKKIGDAHRGKKISEAHILSIRNKLKGRIISDETRLKLSKALSGRNISESHKQKLSIQKIGRNNPMFGKISHKKGKKYIHSNKNSRPILNLETGIFSFGIKDAAWMYNLKQSTLCNYLSAVRPNKTPLIYT